jgi:hypothetical protein
MKLTRMTWIALAALGVCLLAWLALALLSSSADTKSGPAAVDDRHCPECGRELPRTVRDSGGDCPFCKAEGKTVNVAQKRAGKSVLRGPAIPTVLVGAVIALLLVHVFFLLRNRARDRHEEVLYYTNCRKCQRKLRYRERQIGQLAKCPLCHTLIRFPQPAAVSKGRWPAALLGKILGR